MIYFDNSATTKVHPEVLTTYTKVSEAIWGNPSSLHKMGENAYNLLEQSRAQIAELLGCQKEEIFFTSGGTEGDNWAIKGTALEKGIYGKHLITTQVEHPAVLNSVKQLEKLGFEVTYLPVDENGRVSVEELKQALRKDTILVSVMAVNNEVGTIQPIKEIAQVLADHPKVHFHVDAVQAVGKGLTDLIMDERVDLVTFSGHKFHAPRGVGFLYKKSGRKLAPLLSGGGQEKNLRSSTENLPAIAAMAKALRLLLENETKNVAHEQAIRQKIFEHLQAFDKVTLFSQLDDKFAPHILCFAIAGVRGETIVHAFEDQGVFISTTSACSSKKGQVSSTLHAMQVDDKIATSAVRVSLDENNTLSEADKFNQIFDDIYQKFLKINS
ncbi:cysteine desulfurase family protein [Ligilactobacillus animalis]|uniref:cysteine desulfurase family protein n=1 Tax=Ligilactobacillus animalis TaxID=1605 RepID=UPI0010A4798C|nr:cysteine desulfurase family protein [Ligilactobacillus animalis]MDO5883265.1 cysteine desulfurase family protein [Ligilactobacillus animalis]MDU8986188.1 cysteine desulfurase family protein [Ligilactobacillus animalis]THE21671.1 aminotransferase V [Ligilactobacillus animalis]THE22267.1 aminotransferase V [Ligilactobacillus animalis]